MNLSGSIVALVTPMTTSGAVDFAGVGSLIDWHKAAGTAGLVMAGTTGEAALLTDSELGDLVKFAVDRASGDFPVIAGAGTTSTRRTVELSRIAFDSGADALLLVTPYYLKTSQEGLVRHYAAVAEAVKLPQILYNVPARTGCDLLPATAARIAKVAPVVAFKEALADMDRVRALIRELPDHVSVLSGDDPTWVNAMALGAAGVISVTANVAPRQMARQCELMTQGHVNEARAMAASLKPLHDAMFVEPNPIPVKWALAQQDIIGGTLRLPLVELSIEHHETVRQALVGLGLEGKLDMRVEQS